MKLTHPQRNYCQKHYTQGLTLIELMIGMTLGLFIIGGVIGIFVANQQAARTTDSLSHIQENTRLAFELMARDVREAGGTACSSSNRIVNALNGPPAWSVWGDGIRGYASDAAFNSAFPGQATGTGAADHTAGTDAVTILNGAGTGLTVDQPAPTAATFHVNKMTSGIIEAGDILMVCDFEITAIFQMTGPIAANDTVVHNTGTGTPGNCTKEMGYPLKCGAGGGTKHEFPPNSQIVKFRSITWYVGASDRNDSRGNPINSLYRIINNGAPEEVAEGVADMQISYLLSGSPDYVPAAAGMNWANVTAVRIALTMRGVETGTSTVNTNSGRLDRTMTQVVTLRSRVP